MPNLDKRLKSALLYWPGDKFESWLNFLKLFLLSVLCNTIRFVEERGRISLVNGRCGSFANANLIGGDSISRLKPSRLEAERNM